jgi:hypothetical protein
MAKAFQFFPHLAEGDLVLQQNPTLRLFGRAVSGDVPYPMPVY